MQRNPLTHTCTTWKEQHSVKIRRKETLMILEIHKHIQFSYQIHIIFSYQGGLRNKSKLVLKETRTFLYG